MECHLWCKYQVVLSPKVTYSGLYQVSNMSGAEFFRDCYVNWVQLYLVFCSWFTFQSHDRSVNRRLDLKSYEARVNSAYFHRIGNLALQIIRTVCMYSDGGRIKGSWLYCSDEQDKVRCCVHVQAKMSV